jgi:RNA polymerase sigma factor (sigma-70 family)
MDLTVDGEAQQDTHAERDMTAVTSDLKANSRHATEPGSDAPEPLPLEPSIDQVVVGDIPLEPPGFRPRSTLLAELDQAGARVLVIHAVAGLQGLGATQLAAAYARAKLADGWRLVAWVNGLDADSLVAGVTAVADAAGLVDIESGREIADAAQAVRHWLETDGDRCLLVFDDVADPEELRPFIPSVGTARVLITSARQSAVSLGASVPVDVFSADDAVEFLASRTGLDDAEGAAAVAAELGHLPLALAHAAAVIAVQRLAYWAYLDRLRALPVQEYRVRDETQPHQPGVAGAVLLSLQAVRASDRTGVCSRVMEIMAVLSAAGVRRELLHVAGRAGVLVGGRRVAAVTVDRALDWLSGRSLLTFSLDGQTVIMHRLVAQEVRDSLVRRQRLMAVRLAATSVLDTYARTLVGSQDRPAVRGIPQHVTALLDSMAEPSIEADGELARVLLRLRFIALYHLAELCDSAPRALAVGQPLTADLERLLGPDHPDTLNARNSLAAVYLAVGRTDEAISLFEQILTVRRRLLGLGHRDTLNSQNNLAAAYQDAGRAAEAISLYQATLAERERLLGAEHPSTLNSRGNLAAAYRGGGRDAEAIPLFEQTLADRERVLGPDHPDTQTSRRNLAKAYQDTGRADEAIPLLERTLVGWPRVLPPDHRYTQTSRSHAPAGAAAKAPPASVRRPPADPARPVLPAGVRRPPADPARPVRPDRIAGPYATRPDHSSPSRTQGASHKDAEHDREVLAAIMAGDPAGIATAYDRYGAGLYGYCHWMLNDSADAAESMQDTFVLAAATLSQMPESVRLRPWLFALARNECRRRIRPGSAARDEADAAHQRADKGQQADEAGLLAASADQPGGAIGDLADATIQFLAVSEPAGMTPGPGDATIQFLAVSEPAGMTPGPGDATIQFPAVSEPAGMTPGPGDATIQFPAVSERADVTNGTADFNGNLGLAELRALIPSTLADMKPREREVAELSFRHDLFDNDLAVALGLSFRRAHALASHTRGRLEKSLAVLCTALAGRQACPAMGELLADWDGQLTEQTRDLVAWHIEQCQICVNQTRGALRPTVLSGLLPLPPLPTHLREKVLSLCSSTTEDAVAYRRRVVRRAESTWAALFAQAIRRASWGSIRAHPGAAVATTAVAVWLVAAVSVTLLTFAAPRAAHAQADQPTGSHATHARAQASAEISVSPAAAPTTASAPTSAAAKPSPVLTQPSA